MYRGDVLIGRRAGIAVTELLCRTIHGGRDGTTTGLDLGAVGSHGQSASQWVDVPHRGSRSLTCRRQRYRPLACSGRRMPCSDGDARPTSCGTLRWRTRLPHVACIAAIDPSSHASHRPGRLQSSGSPHSGVCPAMALCTTRFSSGWCGGGRCRRRGGEGSGRTALRIHPLRSEPAVRHPQHERDLSHRLIRRICAPATSPACSSRAPVACRPSHAGPGERPRTGSVP